MSSKLLVLTTLVGMFMALSLTCQAQPVAAPGDYNFTLMVGEVQRHALLHIPPGYDGTEPLPLVMMLHGGGGSSRASAFETGWSAKADAENFFVLYPDALARDPARPSSFSGNPQLWNDGSERFWESTGQVDDVAFLTSLLTEVSKRLALDSTRVYLAGHSNGASMAFRFAAERADLVAALAPVAGACWLEEIKLARPVPLCYITGLLDPMNLMEGGVPTLANGKFDIGQGKVKPPVAESIRRWTRALGCPDDPTAVESERGYTVTTYGPAENGAEARLVTIEAQGHNWPGGRGILPESMAGPNSTNLNATHYIWSFFQQVASNRTASTPQLEPGTAYGLFQLYGDEYGPFRQAMGFNLQDYWDYVDRQVAELGVTFTRINTLLIWGMIEPVIGAGYVFDTPTKTDAVICATYAPAPGKQMDLLLVFQPQRGSPYGPVYPTGLESQYQNFVRAVVERYDGDGVADISPNVRVKHWQVMNEPFFQLVSGALTLEQYVQLVKLTSQAVRQADPEAVIVLGDLGPYLARVLPNLSMGDYFDVIDLHFWGDRAHYQCELLEAARASLNSNGYSQAAIWMCEFGTPRNLPQRGLPAQSASEQARWLVKALVANRAAGADRLLWNNLVGWTNFEGDPRSQFNFMGLISSGLGSGDAPSLLGQPTVAYYAFQRLVAETDTNVATLEGELGSRPAGARVFKWRPKAEGPPFYIAWTDQGSAQASFPCSKSQALVLTLVPDESGSFSQSLLPSIAGQVSVELGLDPVLVRPTD